MRGVPLSAYSDDPRLQPPLGEMPSVDLGEELARLKASGMFSGSSAGDDALSSLRGLEESYARIKAGNTAARSGLNDMPEMGAIADDSPMPNLVRYEDFRPEADPSTLDSRAQDASERLVSDPSRGLTMGMKGEIIGKGGTPVDQEKALAASLARETEMGRRQHLLERNRKMKQGWRPMMPGMDPMLMNMPPAQAAQIMVARENAKAQAEQSRLDREMGMAGLASRERIAGMDPGGYHGAMADKARAEGGMLKDPMMQQRSIINSMPDGPEKQQALSEMLRNERQRMQGAMGLPGGGIPSLPPVADKNAVIEQLFEEAESAGIEPGTPEFLEAARRKGISPSMLQEWGQGAAHEAIGIQAIFQPGNLQKNRTKRSRGQKLIKT